MEEVKCFKIRVNAIKVESYGSHVSSDFILGEGGGKRIINIFPLFGNWNILRPHLNALSIYKIGPKFAAGI